MLACAAAALSSELWEESDHEILVRNERGAGKQGKFSKTGLKESVDFLERSSRCFNYTNMSVATLEVLRT